MPFSGSNFGLWTDSNCTAAFSGTLSVVNYTDLSDNPQDFTLYLGAPSAGTSLQALSNPGVDNITLTPADILPEWEASTAYLVGDLLQPTTPNGLVYKCVTAGTSDSSEPPSWPTTGIGSTVVDGSCLWALYAAHHPATEIKLALDSGDLGAAAGGAALAVATNIDGGVADAVPIYIRITNTVATVSNNTGNEEIGVTINSLIETAS